MKDWCKSLLFPLLLLAGQLLHAQCEAPYLTVTHKSISFDWFNGVITTPQNDVLTFGTVYTDNSFLRKFTAGGTPLWSNQYRVRYNFDRQFYQALAIQDAAMMPDSGFVAAADVLLGVPDVIATLGVIFRVDKNGRVLWSRQFRAIGGGEMMVTNIIATTGGDIVAYLATNNGKGNSYGRIMRLSSDGTMKWTTLLNTGIYDAGGMSLAMKRGLIQIRNGNIVLGDVVYKRDRSASTLKIEEGHLHFLALDYANGALKWESSYRYPMLPQSNFVPNITSVSEKPDGQLSFTSSLFLAGNSTVEKGVDLRTDATGHLTTIYSFTIPNSSFTEISDAAEDKTTGHKTFLLQGERGPLLLKADAAGQILWQQGFNTNGNLFPSYYFAPGDTHYFLPQSNGNNWQARLVKTDAEGNNACVTLPAAVEVGTGTLGMTAFDVSLETGSSYRDPFEVIDFTIEAKDYPVQKLSDCTLPTACCTDVVNKDTVAIAACEGRGSVLPDGSLVKEAGTYGVRFTTARGCDSIRYYRVSVSKSLAPLTLGDDVCLEGQPNLKLQATEGYEAYRWMDGLPVPEAFYTATRPGLYRVNVTNACGSKTDSIQVFDNCDFDIYMPDAFTPNGDGLNDRFGVPPSNHNKLVELSVYNRWGQLIFRTRTNRGEWDGSLNGKPLPTGIFVYLLKMEGLTGRPLTKRGTVLLIR